MSEQTEGAEVLSRHERADLFNAACWAHSGPPTFICRPCADAQDAVLERIIRTREAAAEARGAERALREAADEIDRVERVGLTPANEIDDEERAWFDSHALRNVDGFQRHRPVVADWLRARAAVVAARGVEGGAR